MATDISNIHTTSQASGTTVALRFTKLLQAGGDSGAQRPSTVWHMLLPPPPPPAKVLTAQHNTLGSTHCTRWRERPDAKA